jgi:hypothetical protein
MFIRNRADAWKGKQKAKKQMLKYLRKLEVAKECYEQAMASAKTCQSALWFGGTTEKDAFPMRGSWINGEYHFPAKSSEPKSGYAPEPEYPVWKPTQPKSGTVKRGRITEMKLLKYDKVNVVTTKNGIKKVTPKRKQEVVWSYTSAPKELKKTIDRMIRTGSPLLAGQS